MRSSNVVIQKSKISVKISLFTNFTCRYASRHQGTAFASLPSHFSTHPPYGEVCTPSFMIADSSCLLLAMTTTEIGDIHKSETPPVLLSSKSNNNYSCFAGYPDSVPPSIV
jgi:hypothetical protein